MVFMPNSNKVNNNNNNNNNNNQHFVFIQRIFQRNIRNRSGQINFQ